MGYIKKICVGAAAVVGSALLGYFLYKNYFQSKENMDDEEGDSSRTEPNSGKINERQNINSTKDVKTAKNGNSTTDTDKAGVGKTRQSSSLQQAKPKGKNTPKKSETGYMGLRKGFLL